MSRYKTQYFVEFNGQKLTISEFAKIAGMTYASAYRRIIKGGETADYVMNHRRKAATININGESLTIAEAGRRYKVSASTIKGRLSRGYSPEEAVFGKKTSGKPLYKPKGCNWPDCFNCKLDDCYATG